MELELSHLVDALPGLVWTALPDGRAEFVNQRWCEYTGLSLDALIGFGWQSIVHPEDVSPLLERCRSFGASGRTGELQIRLRRHDGEYRRFLFSAAPVTDGAGHVIKCCGVNTEIEEQLKAEEQAHTAAMRASNAELKQAHRYLAEAQRLSKTGSFTTDVVADNHIWSEELYRIFEFDPGMTISMQAVVAVVHPEDLPAFGEAIARSSASGTDFDLTFRIIPRSAPLKYLHCTAHVIEQVEGRPVFIGAIQDVTESELSQAALKASRAELERTHAHFTVAQTLSSMGSFVSDLMADEHSWSEELYGIFEMDPMTPPKQRLVRDVVHPDDLHVYDAAIERGMSGHGVDFEFRTVTSSGIVKHLHCAAVVSQHVAGRPVLMGAVQDISAGKRAEDALNKARSELAHMARVMTLSALTASIAHEVNQPLSGIITNASTCLRMLGADPPNVDGARVTVQRALRDGTRAAQVIQRLRDMFSRKQATREPVDLNEAAREVLALCASELHSSRVLLQTEFEDDLPPVTGDRVQLQQVILNLVLNAADAMKGVADRPRSLLVRTGREDATRIGLRVRDSGVGVDPQNLERLFAAFYTTKSHGMGIGLSISRSIIESHQGRLWATPNDGPGATFSFSIPCG